VIDSHTHLDLCDEPDSALVEEASAAGVSRLLTIGTDEASSSAALRAAGTFESVFAAVGRHPNYATGFDDAATAALRTLAQDARCVAVGETGLDFYRDYAPADDQRRAFAAQIELARELDLPLVIHTRAAEEETLARLAEAADVPVVMHCFSMPERLDECIERAYAISFAGNVTYRNATDLQAAAARVPVGLILVETDAPYLTPAPFRGERNRPALVAHTLAFVAQLRGETPTELGTHVEENGRRVFRWT